MTKPIDPTPPPPPIVNPFSNSKSGDAANSTTLGQTMGSLIFFNAFLLLGSTVNNLIGEFGTYGTQLANQLSQVTQNANTAQQNFYNSKIKADLSKLNHASGTNSINKASGFLNADESQLSAISSAWQVPQKAMQTLLEPVQQAPSTISQILSTMSSNAGSVIGIMSFFANLRITG